MTVGALEHDNLVAAGAPHEPRRSLPARAFHENLTALADERSVMARTLFVDALEQTVVALLLHLVGQLAGHRRRGCVATRTVFENERVVERGIAHQRQGLPEVR